MPLFVDGQDPRPLGAPPPEPAAPDPFATPTFDQTLGAAFRQQNPVVSVIDAIRSSSSNTTPDPDWNPLSLIRGTPYEQDHLRDFLGDVNRDQTLARMAKIDAENQDRQTLANSGFAGTVASVGAGLTDPLTYIPVVGEAAKGVSIARTVLGTAGRMAATGALSTAASEVLLQGSQQDRPVGDSVGNIASGTLLMGLLGAGAGAMLSRGEVKGASTALDSVREDLTHAPADLAGVANPALGLGADAGAAVADTRQLKLKPYGLPDWFKQAPYVGPAVEAVGDVFNRFSPTLRIFSSDSVVAKRAMADLAETPLVFEGNAQGVPTSYGGPPLDRLIKTQSRQFQMASNDALEENFIQYRYGTTPPSMPMQSAALDDLRGRSNGMMNFTAFKGEVHKALYSGDVHPVPQVQRAAQELRGKVFDPIAKYAQSVKGPDGKPMLAEELSPPPGDQSYAPRVWNKETIGARRNELHATITDWLEHQQSIKARLQENLSDLHGRLAGVAAEDADSAKAIRAQMEDHVNAWEGKSSAEAKSALKDRAPDRKGEPLKPVDQAVERILKSPQNRSRVELSGVADEIIDRLLGSPDGRLDYDAEPTVGAPSFGGGQQLRGSLKSRQFAIPTSLVRDFVEKDPQHLVSSYLRSVLPDTMLTERFGDVEMRDVFRKLNEEFAARAKDLSAEKDLTALEKQRQGMIRDLAATRDRVRGTYGWSPDPRMRNAARIGAAARNWNVIADLGTSVFNRLGDAGANAVFRHGFMNVLRDGWIPFSRALVGQREIASAYRSQAKAMAVGVDGMLGHMAHDFGDVMDNYRPGTKFERGLSWAADRSMLVNLHGPWTDWTKTMVSGVASAELLRAAKRVADGAASSKDVERLAAASIDGNMAKRIWGEFANGGGDHIDGVPVPNTRDWKDMRARQAFEAAIGREADIAVITPGLEKPLWMSGPIAGLAGQFKSFVAAANERLLIANLQQMDMRTLQGLVTAVATGMLSYRLYSWLAGHEVSDNPADWIKEGIHRSAILAWMSEANELQAKFTGGASDMYRTIGASSPLSRHDHSSLSELLGPTYARLEGLTGAAGDAVRAVLPGDKPKNVWTAQDTHKLREVMLLQNLFATRRLFDAAEDGINSALGVPLRGRSGKEWKR